MGFADAAGDSVTALGERLVAAIRAGGPMTVADYMAACLGDPVHGYYMRREPFGRGGDFVTAPEVSQMFGELVGLWAVATWQAMGAPPRFVLAEAGPGRGTLMADLLRAARIRPAFLEAAELHLVETSPRLRAMQAGRLAGAGKVPAWHDRVDDLPGGPLILVANEFFDALPIRQFVRIAAGWAERMVGLDGEGRLAFGLRAIEDATAVGLSHGERSDRAAERIDPGEGLKPLARGAEDSKPLRKGLNPSPASRSPIASATLPHGRGEVLETSPAANAIMATLAARIARDGGALLVIDYGYEGPAFGDTLQAVKAHGFADPLAEPGEADLTAHVDFTALAEAARGAGAIARRPIGQGDFLRRLGLAERAARLSAGRDDSTRAAIEAAAERLSGEAGMGALFKVLAVSARGLALPAFADDPETGG